LRSITIDNSRERSHFPSFPAQQMYVYTLYNADVKIIFTIKKKVAFTAYKKKKKIIFTSVFVIQNIYICCVENITVITYRQFA
jgi:hypothetical protein